MIVLLFSDASYDHNLDIGSCGFMVRKDDHDLIIHRVTTMSGVGNVGLAEIMALTDGLQYAFMLQGITHIFAHTDYMNILSRKKANGRFKEIDETIEMIKDYGIGLSISHVYGHRKNKYHNIVDQSCRKELRKYVNQHKAASRRRRGRV